MSILATGQAYKIVLEAKALKIRLTGKAFSAASDFSNQISEVCPSQAILESAVDILADEYNACFHIAISFQIRLVHSLM